MSKKKGFTLVEVILVIAILVILSSLSIFLVIPLFNQFACQQEKENIIMILERARFISQNSKFSSVVLRDNNQKIQIVSDTVVVDEFKRKSSLNLEIDDEIKIGGIEDGCFENIKTNNVGTIL